MNKMVEQSQLISRDTALAEARLLLSKPQYSHEDAARVSGLLGLAERLPDRKGLTHEARANRSKAELAFDYYLHTGAEVRDLTESGATQTTATSDLVQQGFLKRLSVVLKWIDPLFDSNVVNVVETDTGAPLVLPVFDDTASAAQKVSENAQEGAVETPNLSAISLASAPTYRTGVLPISTELLQDAGIDIAGILAAAFGIRLDRAIGPDLVTSLLSASMLGATAAGSAKNTGGTETGATSIGWADLIALRKAVNPAYRKSPKCGWLMSDDTLSGLDALLDKDGRPFVIPEYDAEGNRFLQGFKVHVCPSLPDVAASAKPILFGDLSYFCVRFVKGKTEIIRFNEMFAEYGKVGFRAQARVNSGLLGVTASDSPVKYLQNAAA